MSIPPDSPLRGCAAAFPQPVSEEGERQCQTLMRTVSNVNCHIVNPPLSEIVYRSSSGDQDILRHVFRWDTTPYQQVFQNGFEARRQENTSDQDYYDLDRFVHRGGRPLDSNRPTTHAFVSTTLNGDWCPSLDTVNTIEVYRYEIYGPGGIWVAQTLGNRYQYAAQDEVCFVARIAPQYIRSAQHIRLTRTADTRYTRRERVDNVIRVNGNYNPETHVPRQQPGSQSPRLLPIRRPIFDYCDENNRRQSLIISIYRPQRVSEREKRQVSADDSKNITAEDWYAGDVANSESYINAAFRSSRRNEAYLFMKNEYVLVDYAPGSTNDKVLNGPLLICDGYPSLKGTSFGEHGIDCAFGSHYGDEAYIFSGNLCARINYAPGTTNDKIIKGPMTIAAMFPFFKGTVFESSVDAAFESTKKYEAYLFKGNQYALINYCSASSHLIAIRIINQGFPSLTNTIFESGIDAAFASHKTNEAYLFKGDSYALINFAPGTTNDYIIGGVKKIRSNWCSLCTILPRKNRGLDVHHQASAEAEAEGHRDQDEL